MSKIIVDSSVAAKWLVDEPDAEIDLRILDQIDAGTLTVVVPDILYAEAGNIIWKKLVFGNLSATDAQKIIDEFATLELDTVSSRELLPAAYRLAATHKRTVYDALYLALSEREQCPLVTADEKLVNAVSPYFPNIALLATWSPEAAC